MELDIDIDNIQIFMPGDIITDEPGLMRFNHYDKIIVDRILIRRMG